MSTTSSPNQPSSPDSEHLLQELASHAEELSALPPSDMLDLCRELLSNIYSQTERWSNADAWTQKWSVVNGIDGDPAFCSGTRFLLGDTIVKLLEGCVRRFERRTGRRTTEPPLLAAAPTALREGAHPTAQTYRIHGPVAVPLAGAGITFEVWTRDDQGDEDRPAPPMEVGPVTLVLGAGNQPFLSAVDIIECLVLKQRPVLMKHHPLRPFIAELLAIIFEPLVQRGYYRQVLDTGIPDSVALLSNAHIGHVHLTGSLTTDQAVRDTLAATRPHLSPAQISSMVTSELGCVTPALLPPLHFTDKELLHAARLVVFSKKSQGGSNCLNVNAVVLAQDWPQKDAFRALLRREIRRQPNDPAYYPGARDKRSALHTVYGDRAALVEAPDVASAAHPHDNENNNILMVECGTLGEDGYDNTALCTEAFGPVLAIVELPGGGEHIDDRLQYVQNVMGPFVNNKDNIYGSLSCLLCLPDSVKFHAQVQAMAAALHYGSVCINCPCFIGYLTISNGGIWGCHPKDPTRESGSGMIGNIFDLQHMDRNVVYGPPLASRPIFDLASPPPAFVLDALHVFSCAPTTRASVTRLVRFLTARFWLQGVFSYVLPTHQYRDLVSRYGSALLPSPAPTP